MTITAVTCLLIATAGDARPVLLDRVVGVVNHEVITLSELRELERPILANIPPGTAEEQAAFRRQIREKLLDNLIDRILLRQRAKKLEIEVTDQDIDTALARTAEENGRSVKEFLQQLAENGINKEQYRRQLADQITRSKLVSYEISSNIVISEEMARQYYQDSFTTPPDHDGYHLLQIGISWGTPSSRSSGREEARILAEEVRKMALAGQDFGRLAGSFSELPSRSRGGDIGQINRDEMSAKMREILLNLTPGSISEIIETDKAWQFFMILSITRDGKSSFAPFETVKPEINSILYQTEMAAGYETWLDERRKEALIQKSP